MGTTVFGTHLHPPEVRRVFQDLQGLCPHPPQHTLVARAKGETGLESQRADRVYLWGHLSSNSMLGPVRHTLTQIDS